MANFFAQFPASNSGSNPSVGVNGAAIPLDSTLVGAQDGSGNLQPLNITAGGALKVDITSATGAPVHVIVDSSALPTGAATSANQTSQLTQETASAASLVSIDAKSSNISTNTGSTAASVTSIDTKSSTIGTNTGATATSTASIDTKTPTVGQKAMAASSPVVIASDQSAVPVSAAALPLPTGASTSSLQTTGNTSLSSIDGKLGSLGQKAMSGSAPIVIASDQASIPVAATLQAGAAIIGKVSIDQTTPGTTNGVQVNAALPAGSNVIGHVINDASSAIIGKVGIDQTTPGTTNAVVVADSTASGSITTQNLNPNSGAATAGSTVAVTTLNGQISWTAQVTGTYTGALTPQVTVDGTNWIALSATAVTNINTNAQAATIASAAIGIFEISAPPCAQLRITALGAMTGTAVVSVRVSAATGRVGLDSPIPAGTAIIGALSANQSVNAAQINGVTPLMGNGVTGTGSMRVTIASDTTSNTNAFLVSEEKSATATLTNVASSATTVSLLASTAGRKQATFFNDSTQTLYLKFGTTASTTSYTVQIPSNGYYELPGVRVYTGAIDGIWASANGNVRITELS